MNNKCLIRDNNLGQKKISKENKLPREINNWLTGKLWVAGWHIFAIRRKCLNFSAMSDSGRFPAHCHIPSLLGSINKTKNFITESVRFGSWDEEALKFLPLTSLSTVVSTSEPSLASSLSSFGASVTSSQASDLASTGSWDSNHWYEGWRYF